MDDIIKRVVEAQFPELTGKLHLPRFGQVVGVRETPEAGTIADEYRPYYAVDVQLLDEHGAPDADFPVLHDVPMTLPVAGHESGMFAYPEDGTQVEIGFAYGSPNKPFVRHILPHGRSLPELKRGESLTQQAPGVFARIKADGSIERATGQASAEDSLGRIISALENMETYTKSIRQIDADESVTIGGTLRQRAMGAIEVLSGGRLDFGALGDFNLSGKTAARMKAPKVWVGSEAENVLGLLSELMVQVKQLAEVLSTHTHPSTGEISEGAAVAAVGTAVDGIKARLDEVKE